MKNLKKSEIVDYIQERYNPEAMPEIYFKELPVLKDFSLRGLKLSAGERRKFGCYVCPKDKSKLNVFVPGKSTHYSVPADVFFKFSDPYEISDILRSKKRSRNAVIFTVGKYDYRYVPGICAFVRIDFFNKDFVLDKAVKKYRIGRENLVCVARIFGSGDNYSVFWEIRRKGKNQHSHFFKIFAGKFQEHTYPMPDTQITIGANAKTVVWKGMLFKMTKGRLTIS